MAFDSKVILCRHCGTFSREYGMYWLSNPISTRGDRLCPSSYYWCPRIFRLSGGPGTDYLGNVDLAVHKLFVLLGLSSLTCTKRPRKTLVMSSPTSIRWPDMDGLHLWFLSNTTRSLWKMLIGWTLPLFLIGILIISTLASKPWKGATCWKLMVGLWNDPNTCWWEFLLVSFGVFSTRVWGTPCDLKAGKSRKQFFLKLHWPRTDLNFWHICPSL